ncbi:hypothetical protein N7462_000569 [Penicillium macrosclerotiorum]|uniref:uncharacterized protein n=1 Tax=Penicillium macrosclerotiorum TaxID=303699 RepID=UPI002546F287|nr:uncharacterized protein N7462_000569 [Penicillium macrosclerotiorum]KAJ5698564.1 hypothetical protein N7462_000569 [Penicillium macrosclerotiorum]
MASSTSVLFVPGAWHSPQCFDVIRGLEADNYNTEVVHLPSVDPVIPHLDFAEDVCEIRKKINIAVNAGQRVLVVVHSYGGLPGCEAIRGLDWETRQRQGQPGGVTFHSNITFEAWRYVPSTYLYCLKDQAIPHPVQKMMVEEVAKGVDIHTDVVNASHSPFYTVPDHVSAAIKKAAGGRT